MNQLIVTIEYTRKESGQAVPDGNAIPYCDHVCKRKVFSPKCQLDEIFRWARSNCPDLMHLHIEEESD